MWVKDPSEEMKAELYLKYLHLSYLKTTFLFLIQLPCCLSRFSSFLL